MGSEPNPILPLGVVISAYASPRCRLELLMTPGATSRDLRNAIRQMELLATFYEEDEAQATLPAPHPEGEREEPTG